jgi:hypothetical protein
VFRNVCKTPDSGTWFWICQIYNQLSVGWWMLEYWIFSGIVKDAGCSVTLVQWELQRHELLYHINPVGPWKTQVTLSV